MKAWLAIDQGGQSSRAIAFGEDGTVLSQAAVPLATRRPLRGHVEHEPEELLRSVREAVAGCCAQLPPKFRVRAAGLATQRSSLCAWRRTDGAALSPVISWQDTRHADWLKRMQPQARRVRALSGLVLSPHYGASKMRWCLENLPEVRQAAGQVTDGQPDAVLGPLASFLLFRLLEESPLAADPANAARTQLWSPATLDWSPELCDLFGIDRHLLPGCVPSRHSFGQLPTPAGPVPLEACTGDQSAVPYAGGPLDAARAYVNAGTGAFVLRSAGHSLPEASRLLVGVAWAEHGHADFVLEGTVNGAGSALDWLRRAHDVDVESALRELALADAPARRDGENAGPPLFLNGISGLGSPWWISDFESRFIGGGTPAARVAAVLESIVFMLKENLDAMSACGPPLERIRLSGGLGANARFRQALADLTRVPVEAGEDPEATARGLARLLAGPDARQWTEPGLMRIEPRIDAALEARHIAWKIAMERAGAVVDDGAV